MRPGIWWICVWVWSVRRRDARRRVSRWFVREVVKELGGGLAVLVVAVFDGEEAALGPKDEGFALGSCSSLLSIGILYQS